MNSLQEKLGALDISQPVPLPAGPGVPEAAHVFDRKSVLALRAAHASRRPLLVKGEPGSGKTQLAAAAAAVLGWPLKTHVVDSRTEAVELLWRFDPVRRLAEAQVCGALKLTPKQVERRLDIRRFIEPGPLWWGFDWSGAEKHLRQYSAGPLRPLPIQAVFSEVPSDATSNMVTTRPKRPRQAVPSAVPAAQSGCVVLIDEIDKADGDVPNGLLEALGAGEFKPEGCDVVKMGKQPPLIIITSNDERALPDAFVRRCLVLKYKLPTGDALRSFLMERGRAHFQGRSDAAAGKSPLSKDDFERAAKSLIKYRADGILPLPGLAEYLDLLREVREIAATDNVSSETLWRDLEEFTYCKHRERPPQ